MKIRKIEYFFSSPLSFTSKDNFQRYRKYGDKLYILDDTYTGDVFLIFSKIQDKDNTYVCIELILEHTESLEHEYSELMLLEKIIEKIIICKIINEDNTPIENIIEFYLL